MRRYFLELFEFFGLVLGFLEMNWYCGSIDFVCPLFEWLSGEELKCFGSVQVIVCDLVVGFEGCEFGK